MSRAVARAVRADEWEWRGEQGGVGTALTHMHAHTARWAAYTIGQPRNRRPCARLRVRKGGVSRVWRGAQGRGRGRLT